MSELFDSLRSARASKPSPPRAGSRVNRGEAVLASLGYKPVRRTNPVAVSAVALLALVAAGYYAWSVWPTYAPGDRTYAPGATAGKPTSAPGDRTNAPGATAGKPTSAPGDRTSAPGATAGKPDVSVRAPAATPPTLAADRSAPPSPRPAAPVDTPAKPVTEAPVPPPTTATAPPPVTLPRPAKETAVATTNRETARPPEAARIPPTVPPAPTVENQARRVAKPSSPARATPVATGAEAFALAVYHQRAGDFENALLGYRTVLEKNELNAQARNNLGLLYLDKGLHDDAVRELKRALIIDPRYVHARNNLGVAMMRMNRLEDAAREFQSVLAQDPRNVDALVNLALVEKTSGTVERAKELLIRAVGISPRSAWAHYNLAVVFDHSGEVARAVEHYRSFLDNAGPEVSARAPDVRARLDALTRR